MAFPYIYPTGLGYSLGDPLLTAVPLYTSRPIYYVDNSNANAANSGTGKVRNAPWLTLVYALTHVTADSIIVLGADHDETVVGASYDIDRLLIVGASSSGGIPTATLRFTSTSLTLPGDDNEIRCFKVVVEGDPASGGAIIMSGASPFIRNIYAEVGSATVTSVAIGLAATVQRARIDGLYGVSVALEDGAKPYSILDDGTTVRLDMVNCTFDGGASGFKDKAAYCAYTAGKQVGIENLSLLRDADISVNASNRGWVGIGISTGESLVEIA